jgi:hypothetical protein
MKVGVAESAVRPIHLMRAGNDAFLNYYPKTAAVQAGMRKAIPILRLLLPFGPRQA